MNVSLLHSCFKPVLHFLWSPWQRYWDRKLQHQWIQCFQTHQWDEALFLLQQHAQRLELNTFIHHESLLSWCIRSDQPSCAMALIHAGALVDLKDMDGRTPLMWASLHGYPLLVEALLNHAVDFNAREQKYGGTALLWASRRGHLSVVQSLIRAGAPVNLQDPSGWTALMLAAFHGHEDLLHWLLNHGADFHLQNDFQETALLLAERQGHGSIVECLKSYQNYHQCFSSLEVSPSLTRRYSQRL